MMFMIPLKIWTLDNTNPHTKTIMTKREALRIFKNDLMGVVPGDDIYTRENWANYTDFLCKNGDITMRQYETWDNPF